MIKKIFDSVIDKIIQNEKPTAVLLVGSAANSKETELERLRDIDIFVIIEKDTFYREVKDIEGIEFDISYLPITLLKKAIEDRISSLVNVLYNSKVIYKSGTMVDKYLNDINDVYIEGPEYLEEIDIRYVRFRLCQMYETILSKKTDEINLVFLINNFIKELLYSYFKLNRLWTPSDKKMIQVISKTDNILYSLIVNYYNSHNINDKIKVISDVLDYVIQPFGGALNQWEKAEYPFDFI
ncbi:hypothetical protein [Brassicibacter mesophilus]|uniref:hypothetical protein n=1 Tax=Brassicibacter mesophilus TaxID=745119 RepID=UPI003D19E528